MPERYVQTFHLASGFTNQIQRASQSAVAFARFQDNVNQLCDSLRLGDLTTRPRSAHHLDTIARTQELLPEEDDTGENDRADQADLEFDHIFSDSTQSTWNPNATKEMEELIAIFSQDANNTISPPRSFDSTIGIGEPPASDHMFSTNTVSQASHATSFTTTPICPPEVTESKKRSTFPTRRQILSIENTSATASQILSPASLSTPNKYRCHCGYEPIGSEEWKASNFARHKRTQHAPPKVYRCQHPGCKAKYRRSDNLRAHLKLKGHGEEETVFGIVNIDSLEAGDEDDIGEQSLPKSNLRPSKRVKRRAGSRSRPSANSTDPSLLK